MATDPVHDIRPGLEVHAEDGERLGSVKEVTPAEIKVDAPMRPDFWLPRDHVLSYTNERVTMDFPHADLYRYERTGDER
jgi:hypothetical protein